MADQRYLKKRGGTWHFAMAIPHDLRALYAKERIVIALKTDSLQKARELRVGPLEQYRAEFKRRRAGTPDPDPQALLDIDAFARGAYHDALANMQATAGLWGQDTLAKASGDLFDDYCAGNYRVVAKALAAYCAQRAIVPGSELYKAAGNALLTAQLYAVIGRKSALDHQETDDPKTFLAYVPVNPVTLKPLCSAGRSGRLIFAEVAARFIAEKQRDPAFKLTEQTRGQYEVAYRLFDQFAKQPTLDAVDRRTASDFLDTIATLSPRWGRGPGVKKLSFAEVTERFGGHTPGLANKTINRYAMALSMVWQFAEDRDGFEGKNLWTGQLRPTTKRRGNSETDKRGFTPREITTLLERTPDVAPPKHDTATALPWLTLISAYSGMRLNEVCALDIEDVKETGGVLFFDLTTAKTEAGVRCVPVHSKIIAAGFRDYMANIKTGALWPGLKPGGPDDKLSWYVSKRFTEYRRGLKLSDFDKVTGRDRLDFHSLRRSAVTALKHARIPEHDVAEVMGHEHPRITFGVYPDRQQIARLQAVVEAIRYG